MDVKSSLDDVLAIERCVLEAWPAAEVVADSGWLLRCADGVTRRANSVWPNGEPAGGWTTAALNNAVARVERFYHRRGLPPRFQVTRAARPAQLDDYLGARGYVVEAPTDVCRAPVAAVLTSGGGCPAATLDFETAPSPAWLAGHQHLGGYDAQTAAVRGAIMARIGAPAAFWTAFLDGAAVGQGVTVATGPWAAIFSMAVEPAVRRQGIATSLLQAMAAWALGQGATHFYLQVVANNAPAQALYARAGFARSHGYFYRTLFSERR